MKVISIWMCCFIECFQVHQNICNNWFQLRILICLNCEYLLKIIINFRIHPYCDKTGSQLSRKTKVHWYFMHRQPLRCCIDCCKICDYFKFELLTYRIHMYTNILEISGFDWKYLHRKANISVIRVIHCKYV